MRTWTLEEIELELLAKPKPLKVSPWFVLGALLLVVFIPRVKG